MKCFTSRFVCFGFAIACSGVLAAACSSDPSESEGSGGTEGVGATPAVGGDSALGGTPTGGISSTTGGVQGLGGTTLGGTGGNPSGATGGTTTGGTQGLGGQTGGAATGGTSTGGTSTGGTSTGGTSTGGTSTGGTSTGGTSTGGTSTGGTTTGGTDAGGTNTGGQGAADTGGSAGTGGAGGFNPCPTNGDPCKILPFGDSITEGVGSSDGGAYRSKLFGLAVAANQNITFVGSNNGGPNEVDGVPFPKDHEGHSGWTIDPNTVSWGDGISKLVPSPAFDDDPHIVLLMIGTNDVNADSGQDQMPSRLEGLLDKIVDAAPDALIVLAKLTPIGWSPQALDNYNNALPGIVDARAAAGQHFVLVDMSQMPTSDLGGDDLHPNDQGYAYMADVWYAAIADLLPN